jgi:hypothetical protein
MPRRWTAIAFPVIPRKPSSTILNHPAFSRETWEGVIDTMRTAYGTQIAPGADDEILAYLATINGVRRDRWR